MSPIQKKGAETTRRRDVGGGGLKRLGHQIDWAIVWMGDHNLSPKKRRGWFLNFQGAPPIFRSDKHIFTVKCEFRLAE